MIKCIFCDQVLTGINLSSIDFGVCDICEKKYKREVINTEDREEMLKNIEVCKILGCINVLKEKIFDVIQLKFINKCCETNCGFTVNDLITKLHEKDLIMKPGEKNGKTT